MCYSTTLDSYETTEKEKTFKHIRKKLSQGLFDFSKLPLFKVALIQKEDREFSLIFFVNHIIADGWSIHIFFSFLNTCYGFLEKGLLLPKIPSYLDYTLSYKKFCRQKYYENDQFWKQKTSHLLEYNNNSIMANYEKNSADESLRLCSEQYQKVNQISFKYNTSAFYIFMTLWSKALSHFMRVPKITFFTTCHNRSYKFKGLQDMIGSVSRMSPVFLELSKNQDFTSALEKAKYSYLESMSKNDSNIFKYYFEFSKDKLNRNRFAVGFNYIDCRSLSQNLEHFPFTVDINNCEVQIARNQKASHPNYIFISFYHYSDHIYLQINGSSPSEYKKFILQSIRDQLAELDTHSSIEPPPKKTILEHSSEDPMKDYKHNQGKNSHPLI